MRLSAEAMNAALSDFQGLKYQTQVAAAFEAFLTAKWVEAHESGASPSFSNVGRAVPAVFGVLPDHELGRLAPFKYDWKTLAESGRKTVWNNNSRGGNKQSLTLFVSGDIRNGLKTDAAQLLGELLPAERPSWHSLAVLVLRARAFGAGDTWTNARQLLLEELKLSSADLDALTVERSLGVDLIATPEWSFESISESLGPEVAVVITARAAAVAADPSTPADALVSIVIDSRVERMLRLALATYSSILLVGPPGTGKGTLLRWALADVAVQPARYGFPDGFKPDPLWRTPDESWTAFDLIGGLAPDAEGLLTWSPGALLNAVAEDRWLVLDETNRADMDKIMGPLLTWLSRQEVEVGRSNAHSGKPLRLGWSDAGPCVVSESEDGVRYLVGHDWRLLGTYNPQDAQRVFRFGQALSRRFVIVPIPALRSGQFAQLLATAEPALPEAVADAIGSLYTAHLGDQATALGPAVFLGMARYVRAGLPVIVYPEAAQGEDGDPAIDEGSDLGASDPGIVELQEELLAEAYVLGLGRYLAGYEDRIFDALGQRIVEDETALTAEQWTWTRIQRDILS